MLALRRYTCRARSARRVSSHSGESVPPPPPPELAALTALTTVLLLAESLAGVGSKAVVVTVAIDACVPACEALAPTVTVTDFEAGMSPSEHVISADGLVEQVPLLEVTVPAARPEAS